LSYQFLNNDKLTFLRSYCILQNGGLDTRKINSVLLQRAQTPPKLLEGGAHHLWVFSTELAPCHPSGGHNFEVAPTFSKNQ